MKIVKQLTYSFVDCTPSSMIIEYNCNDAKYETDSLVKFTKHCAPEAWKDFFGQNDVINAIEMVDKYIKQEHATAQGYHIEPPMQHMFEAFKRVKPQDVKVVILGQDPTPQVGKATGRAFSVEDPRTVGSVMNVLLEVALGGWSVDITNGDLSKWENQGVLLLNSALTIGQKQVEKKTKQFGKKIKKVENKTKMIGENIKEVEENPKMIRKKIKKVEKTTKKIGKIKKNNKKTFKTEQVSHLGNWCPFTKLLIEFISKSAPSSVWMLWGKTAQDFTVKRDLKPPKCYNVITASTINIKSEPSLIESKHYVLTGGHPSPLASAGGMNTFFGGNYFNCANKFLSSNNRDMIDWGLVVTDDTSQSKNPLQPCPPHDSFLTGGVSIKRLKLEKVLKLRND